MGGAEIGLAAAFAGGALSFLSPCVLPLVPPYLAFIAAARVDHLRTATGPQDTTAQGRIFVCALGFVLGLGTVFVGLGATASVFGAWLAEHRYVLGQISGIVIIVFGLHFLGAFRIPILNRDTRFDFGRVAGGPAGAYVMGLAFAFGWTPCIGPILASILFVAAQRETTGEATLLLSVYAAGLGVPFLIAAAFVQPFQRFLRRVRPHLRLIEAAMGVFLIGIGIAFLAGVFSEAAFWLLEAFPALGRIG